MENLCCFICRITLNKPKMCAKCQTPFCDECIAKEMLSKPFCPKCEAPLNKNDKTILPYRMDSSCIIKVEGNSVNSGNFCKDHNKELTLYCENCSKDLCASCLNLHLYHRVIDKKTNQEIRWKNH